MKNLCLLAFAYWQFTASAQHSSRKEDWRPQFHYTPEVNWCNDPNGLVYHNGVYHLFYQFNPFGNVWGHMSWGHATSKDLLHWNSMPIAIPEVNDTMAFSGSAVIDKTNTSKLAKSAGQIPMVAIYTAEIRNLGQRQNLAYSLDNGNAWTIYNSNPILDLHKKDFRDPFVAWYAPASKWIMAVMLPIEHIVQFYDSRDLKSWNLMSQFGPAGDTSAVWECPSLIEVPVAGKAGQKKWLLQMSQNASMQYFIGDFDGTTFKAEQNSNGGIQRPDYGPDYYAAIPFNNLPASSAPVAIGWINNWNYANDLPTTPWKGAMSIPRTLSIRKSITGWELLQQPIAEIKSLRKQQLLKRVTANISQSVSLPVSCTQCEINLDWQPGSGSRSGIRLASDSIHYVEIGYDANRHMVYVDRSKSSDIHFHKAFDSLSHSETPLITSTGNIKLHVFIDRSMVEVFVGDGEIVFTTLFFPAKNCKGMQLFSLDGNSTLNGLEIWSLGSVWP